MHPYTHILPQVYQQRVELHFFRDQLLRLESRTAFCAPIAMAQEEEANVVTVEEHVSRSDSVYALAVTKLVKTGWHLGTLRLVGALLFTVFLQLALVGLLWQVAATGNLNSKRSEADNIWVELGRIRRHVVQLQDNITHMPPSEPLPLPCLETLCMYWPYFPGSSSHNLSREETYRECIRNACCLFQHPECLLALSKKEQGIQNDTYVDLSVGLKDFVQLCYADQELARLNMTEGEYLAQGCEPDTCRSGYATRHQLPDLEYGWGLFHTTDSLPTLLPPSCGSNSEGEPNEGLFVGHVNDWFHRDGYEHEPTLFVMVSYLVMLVVSFNEVRQALHLLVYAAAKSGALPSFYAPGVLQQGQVPDVQVGLSGASACFILVAPVLQLLVAFVLMACGGGLLLITDLQNSRASIIFNAVALAFVVELDDRIGLIMRMQQPWMRKRDDASTTVSGTTAHCRSTAGYIVFGVVGWLLLSHALLVAPQTPAQILAFFTWAWAYMGETPELGATVLRNWTSDDHFRDGMTYNIFLDPRVRAIDYIELNSSIWNTYAFQGFAGLTRMANKIGPYDPIDRAGAIVMCSMYLLVAVLMVLLLCHSLLPCKAAHWRWVLTCAQVVLVVVAQLQYLTVHKTVRTTFADGHSEWVPVGRNSDGAEPMEAQRYGFLAVLIMLFVSWLSMFVVWPFFDWAHQAPDGEWARVTHLIAVVRGWPGTFRRAVVRVPCTPSNMPQTQDGATNSKHGAKPSAPATEPSDVEGAGDQAV